MSSRAWLFKWRTHDLIAAMAEFPLRTRWSTSRIARCPSARVIWEASQSTILRSMPIALAHPPSALTNRMLAYISLAAPSWTSLPPLIRHLTRHSFATAVITLPTWTLMVKCRLKTAVCISAGTGCGRLTLGRWCSPTAIPSQPQQTITFEQRLPKRGSDCAMREGR